MMEPSEGAVQCLSPAGLHTLRYTQWGDPHNPRVVVCVHGLARTGRDFDRLARVLAPQVRVVCPDVAGRGRSDWLGQPLLYQIPQYVADMVTLIARLDVATVSWVGTSMGGLIGMGLAGMKNSPISRLVLNDVGPRLEAAALARIGTYVGKPVRFASLDEAVAYTRTIGAGFALRSEADWREMTASTLVPDGDGFIFHYDPAISAPLRAMTPEAAAAAEGQLWSLFDAITAPTLLLHGAQSDLLTQATVREMQQRGPRPAVHSFAGVGHAPMLFDADQIEPVREFLLAAA